MDAAVVVDKLRTGTAVAALVCGIIGMLLCLPLSRVGLVLGILGMFLCLPLGIVGLVLGIIATARAANQPQRYGGKGLAITGICTSGASLLIAFLLMALVLLPSLSRSRARENAKRATDASEFRAIDAMNLRGIAQAMLVYVNDNGDHFPPHLQVLDGSINPKQLVAPSSGHTPPACDYYYVTGLTQQDPQTWILAYSDPNYHNGEGANILYLNGFVQFVEEGTSHQFSQELQRFRTEYEAARRHPPTIIPPK